MLQIVYSFVLSTIIVVPKVKYSIYVDTWTGEIFSTPSIGPWICKPRTDRNVRFLQWPSPGYAPRLGGISPARGEQFSYSVALIPRPWRPCWPACRSTLRGGLYCHIVRPWPPPLLIWQYICGVFYHWLPWYHVITRLHCCGWYYRIENTSSKSSSVVSCVLFAAGTSLPSRCLLTPLFWLHYSGSCAFGVYRDRQEDDLIIFL